jgi:hypothetical protein
MICQHLLLLHPPSIMDKVVNLLGISATKGTILASVLAKAPHLEEVSPFPDADSHLEKIQELLSVFSPQATQDALVTKAQFTPVAVPLPT